MKLSKFIALAAACLASFVLHARAGLVFTNTFDSTWGTELSIGQTAVANAEAILSSIFVNNVNVKITFSYGSGPGGGAYTGINYFSYASVSAADSYNGPSGVKTWMQYASRQNPSNTVLSSVLSYLPASNPSSERFILPYGNALALGISLASSAGTITVGNGTTWDPNETGGIPAGQGDLTGVLLHEISHAMGRVDYAFDPSFAHLTPLDLSRYSLGGGLNFGASGAYFSINGGASAIADYSSTSDTGDWGGVLEVPHDANDAYFNYGATARWTQADTEVMQAIGWETRVPESTATLGLLSLALGGMAALRRKFARS